jgi:hypothetical protein
MVTKQTSNCPIIPQMPGARQPFTNFSLSVPLAFQGGHCATATVLVESLYHG